MQDDTKVAKIRTAMAKGDWPMALRIASRFKILGEHADAIKRAADALSNPALYRQMGFDIETVKNDGISALKKQFSKSWEAVKQGEKQGKQKREPKKLGSTAPRSRQDL